MDMVQLLARKAVRSPIIWSVLTLCTLSLPAAAYSVLPTTAAESPDIIEVRGQDAAEFGDINEQLQSKRYEAVVRRAREVLARKPQSALAYEVLGIALQLSDHSREAVNAYKKAHQLNPRASGPLLRLASLQMESNELDAATSSLQAALTLAPNDRFAHQRLGLIYEHQQKNALAIEHLQKGLIGAPPQYLGVAVNLGRLLNEQAQYRATLDMLEPRAPLRVNSAMAQEVLGTAQLGLKQYAQALDRFDRAIALDATLRGARIGRVITLRERGKFADALAEAQQLTIQHVDWGDAHIQLGESLLSQDRVDEAKEALGRGAALKNNPAASTWPLVRYHVHKKQFHEADTLLQSLQKSPQTSPEVFAWRSEILQALGQNQSGLAILQTGLGKYPDNVELNVRLGSYQAALGQYKAAIAPLQRASQLQPRNPNILKILSMAQSRAGDHSGAIKHAQLLYEMFPDGLAEAVFYCSRLEDGGRRSEAETLYRQLLTRAPNDALILNNLASLLSAKGEFTEAETLARQAVRQAPSNALILDTLGWTLHQQQRYEEANRTFEQAIKLARNIPIIWYHHGLVLEALKKDPASKQSLQRALVLEPNAIWADEVRKRL